MKTETLQCYACGTETEHVMAGFMPLAFVGRGSARDEYDWANCGMCLECGGLSVLPVSDEQLEAAHDRYIRLLVDYGVMTRSEVERQIGESI